MSTSRLLALDLATDRAGTAPATWGQHAIWDVVRTLGTDAARYNVVVAAPVAPALPVAVLLAALRDVFCLHDSLRTRLTVDDAGRLTQVVDAAGRVTAVVRECAPADVTDEGTALLAELSATPFDCAREWPVRIGVVEADGMARYLALSLSHTAVDAWGLRRMVLNMAAIATGELTPAAIREQLPSLQPMAEAEFQASERGQRLDARSRRYWRERLRTGPAHVFPHRGATPGALPFPNAVFNSPALHRAVAHVAAVRQVSTSSVLLAAASTMTSRLSGTPDAVFQVVVNNRFLPGLTYAVSTLAQEGLFHLSNADGEFADVVRRTHMATLATYRTSYYDKGRLDADIAEADVVGDHSCFFNDTRNVMSLSDAPAAEPSPVPLAAALARTTLTWPVEFEPRRNVTLAMDARDAPDSIELVMTADSALVPKSDMAALLYGIEGLVVADARALGHD